MSAAMCWLLAGPQTEQVNLHHHSVQQPHSPLRVPVKLRLRQSLDLRRIVMLCRALKQSGLAKMRLDSVLCSKTEVWPKEVNAEQPDGYSRLLY